MMQLVASILALGVGPTLDSTTRKGGPARAGLDAFTFVAMLGLILGHIIPDAFKQAGWPTLVVAIAACFGPTFFEKRIRSLAERAHLAAMVLGALGLIIHGTFDGMALVDLGGNAGWNALAVGVILHRIPAGLTLWWLFRPKYGRLRAQLILAGLAVTTVLGYIGAESLQGRVTEIQEGYFMALVGGALLHVVMHRTGHSGDASLARVRRHGAFVGSLLAGVLLYLMSKSGRHFHPSPNDTPAEGSPPVEAVGAWIETFLMLARESAPALLIAFTGAGLIQVFLPKSSIQWMSRGGPFTQSLKGVAFGLPLPICSCGVVPVYKSLAARGVPVGAGLAFLVATPELGIDAVLLSLPLLGREMMIARVIAAALVAVLVAWFIARARIDAPTLQADESVQVLDDSRDSGFLGALKVGWVRFFDSTAPWILLGLVVAAVCQPLMPDGAFDNVPTWLQVPLFAVIGMPLYVCASGATPIVAVFLMKGVSPGAALAFLLTGPATNLTTFGLLQSLHGKKLALTFVIAIITVTVGLGLATNVMLGAESGTSEVLHQENGAHADHQSDGAGILETVSLWILAGGLLLSLWRQGPQGFMSHVFSQAGGDHHHHHDSEAHDCCTPEPPPEEESGCCH